MNVKPPGNEHSLAWEAEKRGQDYHRFLHDFSRRCYRRRLVWHAVGSLSGAEGRRAETTLTQRVEILEQNVQSLETLPTRVQAVELQIVQLREEMRGEFSAVRAEMNAMETALRAEIRAGDEETRRYMRVLHEEVISRIDVLGGKRRRRRNN